MAVEVQDAAFASQWDAYAVMTTHSGGSRRDAERASVVRVRRLVRTPLAFGLPTTDVPDPGLFGPGSATWEVTGDAAAGVGGIRALLLQALHPSAMATVDRLSDYRRSTWARLLRTAEYVGMTCFGTTEEADRTSGHVRALHERLGILDTSELLWVHAALIDSVLDAYLRTHPDAPADFGDRYINEQRLAATLVGIDEDDVFATMDELKDYLEAMRPTLAVTPPAMTAADALLVPWMPWFIRWLTPAVPFWRYMMTASFICLPLWVQNAYAECLDEVSPSMRRLILNACKGTDEQRLQRADRRIRLIRKLAMASPAFTRIGPHVSAAYQRLGMRAADHH